MTDQTQDNTDTGADDAADTSALGDAVAGLDTGNDDDAGDDGDKSGDDAADGDDKGASDKKDGEDGDDKSSGAPEAYDTAAFEMPEGVEFDQEGFEAVEPILRELDLSQEKAGKLMTAYGEKIVPLIEARTEKRIDDLGTKLKADLARELHADEVVGGEHLEESKALSARAIQQHLPNAEDRAQFTQFLNESGMGNNRFLMRILTGAGRALAEAGTPSSDGDGGSAKTTAEKFYGS